MGLLLRIALWAYMARFSTCNLTDLEWETILPDITSLCPSIDVCGRTDVDVNNSTVEKNPCCLGCSCDRDCDGENCCFYDDNNIERNESKTACLKPSVNQSIERSIGPATYRFIMGPPTNGCVVQDHTATCSPDVTVAPWGNFFPVYSKSLNKNFKNEPCAKCHGADYNDIEHWKSYIIFTGMAKNFVSAMTGFYETYNSNEVNVVFGPPSQESSSLEMRCFEVIDECIDTFYIPSFVHLGRAEIIKACNYGPRALNIKNGTHAYKNPFCEMCFLIGIYEEEDTLKCNRVDDIRSPKAPITGLIDTNIIQSSTSMGSSESRPCFRQKNELNDSRCVQPYCPALQVRVANGQCKYPSEKMTASCFRLFLKVSAAHMIDKQYILNMTGTQHLSTFQKKTPWHDGWRILVILLGPSTNRTEFHVVMSFSTNEKISMHKLIIDMERRLSKPWSLHINDKIEYTQMLLPTNYGDEVILYKAIAGHQRFCPAIGILYFCQQIELRPSEYTFLRGKDFDVVNLVHNGKALVNNEFEVIPDTDGTQKVRVCLEDSGYVRVDSAACMSFGMHYIPQVSIVFLVFYICALIVLDMEN